MRVVEKKVYYCGHCKKHGLSRPAMEKHERGCTLNPDRRCRWGGNDHVEVNLRALVAAAQRRGPKLNGAAIDWLRAKVDGCPACMLAALRQSGVEYHYDERGLNLWDYGQEVERFRQDERRAEDYAEMRAIESGWA